VAERLQSAPAVIGFDVLNEPMWGSYSIHAFERELLAPLYSGVVKEVRRHAPDWVAFLEPGASRNLGIGTGLRGFDFADVVYAPHSYDSAAENGDGFDPARRALILDNAVALRAEAQQLGAALWVGEYGGVASAPGIAAYMDAEYDAFAAVAAGSIYWSYDRDDGYGLLNPDGTEKPVLAEALVRPYPERVAGDPVSWSWDPETATFQLTYAPDSSQTAPTELSLPPRCFPAGYAVECDACDYESIPGGLRLRSPPSGSPATVIVRSR
jgi:endoglycosylceramidase